MNFIYIIIGLVLLVLGGNWLLKSAIGLSLKFNISKIIVGLTVVSFATSAPEMIVSVKSALAGYSDIALGNVIGSNIFNVFFILSISAIIRPLPAYKNIYADLLVAALGSLLVLLFVSTNKKHSIKRWGGALLLLIYTVYLVWMISLS